MNFVFRFRRARRRRAPYKEKGLTSLVHLICLCAPLLDLFLFASDLRFVAMCSNSCMQIHFGLADLRHLRVALLSVELNLWKSAAYIIYSWENGQSACCARWIKTLGTIPRLAQPIPASLINCLIAFHAQVQFDKSHWRWRLISDKPMLKFQFIYTFLRIN